MGEENGADLLRRLIGFTAGVGLVIGAQMLRGYVEDYRRGRAIRARRDGLGVK